MRRSDKMSTWLSKREKKRLVRRKNRQSLNALKKFTEKMTRNRPRHRQYPMATKFKRRPKMKSRKRVRVLMRSQRSLKNHQNIKLTAIINP